MEQIYIIIEGEQGKSQYELWGDINKYIYNNKLTLIGCGGAKNILKTFNSLYNKLSTTDRNNSIFIFDVDTVLDNKNLYNVLSKLSNTVGGIPNAFILDFICFEHNILTFESLSNWVYCTDLRSTNKVVKDRIYAWIEFMRLAYSWKSNLILSNIALKYYNGSKGINDISTENMSNIILSAITNNAEFKVTKSALGNCFRNNCKNRNHCMYYRFNNIPKSKRCGLAYNKRKTEKEKIIALYYKTIIHKEMKYCREYFLRRGYEIAQNIMI